MTRGPLRQTQPPERPRDIRRQRMTLAGELKRKAIHISALSIPIGYYFVPVHLARQILLGLFLILLLIDMTRLQAPRVGRLATSFLGDILRRREARDLLAATYLIGASLLITYAIPQKQVAIAALAFLIIGDTVAALVGMHLGRVRVFGKTLEGSLACFLSCLAVSWVVATIPPPAGTTHLITWPALVVGSLVATIFEVLPIPIDDNFRIPLAAGIAMLTVLG